MAYESEGCQMDIVSQRLHGGVCRFLRDGDIPKHTEPAKSPAQAELDRLKADRLCLKAQKGKWPIAENERKADELGRLIFEAIKNLDRKN